MKGLVAACAAGKIAGRVALDMSDAEDKQGDADLPVAYIPRTDRVSLLQMDGILSQEEFDEALSLAVKTCKEIHAQQQAALKEKYVKIKEEVEELPSKEVTQ
jgi:exosome complex component RRP41